MFCFKTFYPINKAKQINKKQLVLVFFAQYKDIYILSCDLRDQILFGVTVYKLEERKEKRGSGKSETESMIGGRKNLWFITLYKQEVTHNSM